MPRKDRQEALVRDNLYAAQKSRIDRDVGFDFPGPGDLERRGACRLDLRRFLGSYFGAAFPLPWGSDHLRVIDRMEESILRGGLFAVALPRGGGKTSISTRAAIWALLYGHRRFVALIGATEKRAGDLLRTIKTELTCNPAIVADFRQVTHALVRLENHARKAMGQLFDGEPTKVEWAAERLTFPFVPARALDGADVGGSTVSVAGLTGSLRGQATTLPNGTILRPELVILDDVQTRESAMSTSQSAERLAIISGDVLGMGGPNLKISAVACCTVIRAGDTADMLLDRERSARWHGEKCKLLDSLPTDEKLWDTYGRIRAESLRGGGDGSEATSYYVANRAAMDLGASAPWPARFLDDEISAIQHGMNLKIDDEASFMAEYQQTPMRPDLSDNPRLTPAMICGKTNGIERGVLPAAVEYVTGMIDVHDNLLYYCVAGWSPTFDGWICDYGTWPKQPVSYFRLAKAPKTLALQYPGTGKEAAIRSGLMDLTATLLTREWRREDGAVMRIGRCLIDSGYVASTVFDVCAHSVHATVLTPSKGEGVTASRRPISEYDRKRGDHIGHFWLVPRAERGTQRYIRVDTNYWKTFIHARFATALGDPGSLSLWGHDPEAHRLFADHLTAEVAIRTAGQGRTLDEWKTLPDRQDQHWFDSVVGCAAAASYSGAVLPGSGATKPEAKKKMRFSELQRQARERQRHV